MIPRLALLFALAALCACGDAERPRPPTQADARVFVPMAPGDRWRMRTTPPGRLEHLGITAVDAQGRAALLGTARTTYELLDARSSGVWTVSPEGERLMPVVASPLRVGATTRYRVRQGEGFGECSLEVRTTDARASVAGVAFEGCIEQRRICRLPAGGGLPRATTFTDEETRCPKVGLVALRSRIEPPLPFPGVANRSESRLLAYHVRGAPMPPAARSIADRLIVLPSDVAVACGGATGPSELRVSATSAPPEALADLPLPADARSDDVLLAFSLRDGPFLVEARPAANAPGDALASYAGERADRVVFRVGDALVRLTPPPSCGPEAARRLEPLIRSMLGSR